MNMTENISHFSPTKRSAIKSIFTAFTILKENGNEMQRKDLINEMEKRLQLEDWEKDRYKSNNQLKWLTIFLFYTVDSSKAGWLHKDKGVWYLTPEGVEAMKLGPIGVFETASKAYRQWAAERENSSLPLPDTTEDEIDISNEQVQKATLDEIVAQASDSIGIYLANIEEYKFQSLCCALLKAMGYYIDFEAARGKDGGIDIVAISDPLGYTKPRIKVQVKRYKADSKIGPGEIRMLKGLLHPGEDIGIFITSSSFTNDAKQFARESSIHIKLIDGENLIELWKAHYHKFSEKEKSLLPLQAIYFLGSNE